jgi:CubicO group peptidase (beta-lactamase class C family)
MKNKLTYRLAIFSALILAVAHPTCSYADGQSAVSSLFSKEYIEQHNIHSVLVMHRGNLISEQYYRGTDQPMGDLRKQERQFTSNDLHDMRSISKTMIGLAIGIAIDEGKISSVKMPIKQSIEPKSELLLEHLLSMSSGLQWNESVGTYGTLANDETHLYFRFWRTRYVLGKKQLHEPGAVFNYNGGNTQVMADLLTKQTGVSFDQYIAEKLFKPLNITNYEWRTDMLFRPVSFAGLRLTPKDLLKIGQLMLNGGVWEGRQIISKEWVEESFKPRVTVDAERRYGYQWWLGNVKVKQREHAFAAAVGNGGQRLFVAPSLDLTVVITAGQYNSAAIGPVLNKMFDLIANRLPD